MHRKYICNKLVGKKYGIKEKAAASPWNVVHVYIWTMAKYCTVGFSMVIKATFFKCYIAALLGWHYRHCTGKFGFYQHEFSCTDLQFLPCVLQVLVMDGWPLSDSRVWRKVEKQQGLNCPQSKYNISCNANTSLFAQKMDKLSILSTTVVFCSMKFLVVAHNQCQATREKTLCCA